MLALALAAALTAAAVLTPCAGRDTLDPRTPLAGNDTLVSADGAFSLGFFTPPGTANRYVAIWYTSSGVVERHSVVWIMNRAVPASNGSKLSMARDGALLLTDAAGRTVVRWRGSAEEANVPSAQLLDSGNFVATDASTGGTLWQSFDYPTDTMIPGMKLGFDGTTGKSWSLTAWTTDSDPSPSGIIFDFGSPPEYFDGHPEYILYKSGEKAFREAPWYASDWPPIIARTIVDNATQPYATFQNLNASLPSMIRANYTGSVQLWRRIAGEWSELWSRPAGPCDTYGSCGLNGVCSFDYQQKCSCLPGFSPKNAADWNAGSWGGGCVRDRPFNCSGGDSLALVSSVKVPDTTTSMYAAGAALEGSEGCKALCLEDCKCTAVTVAANSTGCLMWFGDLVDTVYAEYGYDLYVRLAAADFGSVPISTNSGSGGAPVALVVSLAIASFAVLAGAGGCCYFKVWRKKSYSANVAGDHQEQNEVDLPLLDMETVANATDGFSAANKIGEGGFGSVYRGKLSDGQEIAVKRLAKSSSQGNKEFMNEVRLIAKLQHRNLVRLLGCCIHGDEKILVYEFVPNGSLDAHLFGKRFTKILGWKMRYHIIIGVARGLVYLHEDSRLRIIHRDLKAGNVLLDNEMIPKISDFGLARIFGDDSTPLTTRRVVGTFGYMSPEYVMYGIFSTKSDIFSFGVLILEIITGMRNGSTCLNICDHISLSSHVWDHWKNGKALDVIDASLDCADPQYEEEMLKCLKLGLLCVQEYAEDRPTMTAALQMFNHDVPSSALREPKQPGFMGLRAIGRENPPPYTGNFTNTSVEGR